MLVLVLGGTRSGKSELAEQLAARLPAPITYVATAVVAPAGAVGPPAGASVDRLADPAADASVDDRDEPPVDEDLAARIARHRARRPAGWRTLEVGAEPPGALPDALDRTTGTVLLDSLGTWLAGRPGFDPDVEGLVAALHRRRGDTVVVSDEVGLGVHPSTEVGRRFRDALGSANRAVAADADRVLLVVAGRVLELPPAGEALGR